MLRCFVNCHLRAAASRPERLERHFTDRVPPELGLDPLFLDATPAPWHAALAARLEASALPRSVHLPFFDLQPGSADARIRQASIDRLREALLPARAYTPHHLVGHAAYDRFLYGQSFTAWADRAAQSWIEVLAAWPDHPPLFLENTHETDPATVAGLVAAIRRRLPKAQAERIGVCLDIGHWFSFGGGRRTANLAAWIETLAPYLAHLHLHDNDGTSDAHLGPGQGAVPFDQLFSLLADNGVEPSVTFEPHSDDAYARTLTFVTAHSQLLTW